MVLAGRRRCPSLGAILTAALQTLDQAAQEYPVKTQLA